MLNHLYAAVIIAPIRKLYFFGPSLSGVGFWRGLSPPEICSHLTSYSEAFWSENPGDCHILLENKFYSFLVSIEVLLYFVLIYKLSALCSGGLSALIRGRMRHTPIVYVTKECALEIDRSEKRSMVVNDHNRHRVPTHHPC